MYMHFFGVLFFICSSLYFFLALRKYNSEKTHIFVKIYILIMVLFSIIAFFYGVYYFANDIHMILFIHIMEMCIYLWIFAFIFHCMFNILRYIKSKSILIIYIIPAIFTAFLLSNTSFFASNSVFGKNIITVVFLLYISFFAGGTLASIIYKGREIKDNKYRINLYVFAAVYAIFTISFLYVYVYSPDMYIFSSRLGNMGVFAFIIPMAFMYRLVNNLDFANGLPEDIIFNIINSMNESVILTDKNDNIVYFNKKSEEVIGKDRKNIRDVFVTPSDFDDIEENLSSEIYINTKDDAILSIMVFSNVCDKFGDIRGRIFIFQIIRQLVDARHRLEKVKKDLESKIAKRTRELQEYNEKLQNEINDRVSIEYQIRDIFCYDTLTALYNRAYFIQELENTLFEDTDELHALMFIDLDGFKSVNDSLGHSYGDDVLIAISDRLRHLYKYKNVVISRFGGDEFVILFKDVPSETYVATNAQTILDTVKETVYFDEARIHVSASIGIAMYPKDGTTKDELTKSADAAMYKAKEDGKNQYKFFQEKYRLDIEREYDLTHNLLNALSKDELLLYYQPQICIQNSTASVIGFEALLRWQKDGKIVHPGVFIPVAEKTNIISDMGRWIIFEACSQGKKWSDKYGRDFKIAINLSANQLMNPVLYDEISTALLQTGVEPSCMEFEITETSIVKDIKNSITVLSMLKELGVRIAVDDFGTKYSTFNYLKNLPVDKIKIDISFVRGIGKNKIDEGIILSLISLAKGLDIEIIAEGVETKEELTFLVENGCNNIQGFYFFAPMEVNDLEEREILNFEQEEI
ncbi:EAL domain-containing protein [Peptostreptococcaceae bacterium oral taxon 081]|nr:EAL domain-containing protein [Peptostreptococcaceae bacterium oral taxon 081]